MVRKTLASVEDSSEFEPQDVSAAFSEESPDEDITEVFRQRVSEAAYLKAEQRGFEPGYELSDWLEAEQEVKAEMFGLEE